MIRPGSHKKENEGALTQANNRTANKEPAWLMSLRSLFENLLEALNIIGNLLLHTGVDQLKKTRGDNLVKYLRQDCKIWSERSQD